MFKSVNLSILQKTTNKTSKSPNAFAMCSIRTDLLGTGSFRPESRSPPESFRPYSRSPRVVSPSFINSALKNEI